MVALRFGLSGHARSGLAPGADNATEESAPGDADGDDAYEVRTAASDGTVSTAQLVSVTVTDVPEAAGIASISPFNGETNITVVSDIAVRFDEPVDPATLTDGSIILCVAGQEVAGRLELSRDGLQATFSPDDPLPGSVLGSIEIDGDQIRTVDGTAIDADGDGIAGG